MAIRKEVLQELLKDYKGPEDLLGEDGVLKELTRELVETALGAELTDHLGYDRHEKTEKPTENRRNGTSRKSVRSDLGPIEVDIPRDREGTFEPRLIAKHQREIPGFSDKILSMYARGMTNREIAGHLKELYGTEVSPQFITTVTDGVLAHLEAWRNRELESVYPIVFFDAIVLKIRENGHVAKRSMHLALAINLEGKKELLGLWMAETEGAKYWLSIISELKNRGVEDILIAAVDGLTGFPEVDPDKFCAQGADLLFDHRSGIKGLHPGAEPLGGGDGLEPGDPDTNDKNPGRGDRPRRSHHHGHNPVQPLRRGDDSVIPCQIRLGADGIHFLGQGCPGHHFHRDRVDPGFGESLEEVLAGERIQETDVQGPFAEAGDGFLFRRPDSQDDVGRGEVLCRILTDSASGGGIGCIIVVAAESQSGFDPDFHSQGNQLPDRFRVGAGARFRSGFLGAKNYHREGGANAFAGRVQAANCFFLFKGFLLKLDPSAYCLVSDHAEPDSQPYPVLYLSLRIFSRAPCCPGKSVTCASRAGKQA